MPSQPQDQGDDFLASPDNLRDFGYFTICIECKKPLWKTRILSHDGKSPMSTETLPVEPNKRKFNKAVELCGLCGKRFYAIGKRGIHLYLIKDGKSGITRLI